MWVVVGVLSSTVSPAAAHVLDWSNYRHKNPLPVVHSLRPADGHLVTEERAGRAFARWRQLTHERWVAFRLGRREHFAQLREAAEREAYSARNIAEGGASYGSGPVNWSALAECESGGDPTANTGNGYYGMYQFDQGTWLSVGGARYAPTADQATAAEQTAAAQALYASRGLQPWPVCGGRA